MCLICMKYRIIILIIISISLGQILFLYIANTSRMNVRMYTRAHTHPPPSPFRLSLFDGLDAANHDGVNAPVALAINGRSLLH